MNANWTIYDRLIEGIPAEATVASCLVGASWTLVESTGTGIAMTYRGGCCGGTADLPVSGRPLREVAERIKSWNLSDASLGMAAVNAFYNAPEMLERWLVRPLSELQSPGAFKSMLGDIAGKKVAVIGHFPGLEAVAENCDLIVLERNPQDGDLPDFAAEYVLPGQDFVFITGTAITNKTLPRLLGLCAGATVALVGPSVPLVPWWFDHGVDVLAGSVIADKARLWQFCQEGGERGVFKVGAAMIDIRRDDLRAEFCRR